ncbi:MAG TPA: tetratricopeptide repeat protein [Gammaproteobacteria bacterium]|nr:tetratricopeptide repeat protein [Gammaproteobacteria bacterium]
MKFAAFVISGILLAGSAAALAGMEEDLLVIQQRWASVNYDTVKDAQGKAFEQLTLDARKLVADSPDKAEPLVWLAIILSSDAGATGGISALGKVKEARKLLEKAEQIDATVLNGSVYTSLGSLYYQVPGWPIAFGSDAKAELYLRKALSLNPDGIDPNYFYGDFMLEEGKPAEAVRFLEKAQAAAPRPNRALADKGRQQEVASKLQLARSKL